MNTKNNILLLSLLIAALFAGCAQSIEEKQLVKRDENITIKIEAKVFPSVHQDILAPVDGVVEQIHAKNGSLIKKGDILFEMDTRSVRLDIIKLRNEITLIKKRLSMMSNKQEASKQSDISMHHNAKKYLEKIVRLHAEGYATESELSTARKRYYDSVNANSEKLYTNVRSNDDQQIILHEKESLLQKVLDQVDKSIIRSNYSGYLVGSELKAGSQIARSSKMGSIINIDDIIVKAGLAPGLYPFVKKGQSVKIDFIVTPPYSVKADVSRVIPVIDPEFGRMIVEVELANANYILQDGMKALVTITLNESDQKVIEEYFIDKKDQTVLEVRSGLR